MKEMRNEKLTQEDKFFIWGVFKTIGLYLIDIFKKKHLKDGK